MFQGKSTIHKIWVFLRTYILTLQRFDLILQGSLLIVILLESNVFLLLKREVHTERFSALIEEWVLIAAGFVEFALGAILAWWGAGHRHLSLAAWLGVTSFSGLLVLVVPFVNPDSVNVELCDGEPILTYTGNQLDENVSIRMTILIITALLCALTKVSIWAHGLTYLDDHDPRNGAHFYGILISIRLSLGLSGTNWLRPGSDREDWWEAHLSISMLTLMFAILFTLFPKKMPHWQDEEIAVNTELCASLQRVSTNKTVVMQTIAISFLTTAIFCFVHYDNAFVQARFYVEAIGNDPRTSRALSDIFRSLVIIFFIMIFRVRFSGNRVEGVKANTAARVGGVVAIFVAVFFAVLSVISCDTGVMEGFEEPKYQPLECSQQCGCSSERYGFSPVCGLDTSTTFFSPCAAGCNEYENLNGFVMFHNCSCGDQRAVRGACNLQSCRLAFSAYQVLYTIILAVSGASFLMQGMVLIRVVRRIDKPIVIGFSFAVIAIISFVFGRLFYLLISFVGSSALTRKPHLMLRDDILQEVLTCAYFENSLCMFHRPSLWTMAASSAVLSLLSAIISILSSRVPPEPTTEL